MDNLAKAAIGLTSTGTVCTGGYFVWNSYSSSYMSEVETNSNDAKVWSSLGPSSSKYAAGTMGNIYGSRLLDPFAVGNKEKWEELHKKIVEDEKQSGEKKIKSIMFNYNSVQHPFFEESNQGTSSLNKTCKTYYAKEVEGSEERDTSKIQIGDDDWKAFWMLCSMWNPVMLNKDSDVYPAKSIGKLKGDELLSTKGTDNEALWKEKNTEFFKLTTSPTEGLFKQLYDAHKDTENNNKLKEKCEEIYSIVPTSPTNNENITDDAAVKYCSMKLIV